MRAEVFLRSLLCIATLVALGVHSLGYTPQYGPEVRAFLDLCKDEERELDFQIEHNEISRPEYQRAKNRIAVHREAVLSIVNRTGADVVPELHVVTADDIDELIEGGTALLKTIKTGDVIREKWRFIGKATRREAFFIFERIVTP
jgi:hypothetical protein